MPLMLKKIATLGCLLLISCPILAETYPSIDISGFKKWEYRDARVNPASNYFLGLTHLGGFTPTATGGPWQERLQLKVLAQLSDKLTVTYDIEQQPEAPDRYDVKLNYDNRHELTFGDFTASVSGNEFASVTRSLNGMMITSKDEGYDLVVVPAGKTKSQFQGLAKQNGNNSKGPYNLGHGSILEGTERIELNGILLKRGEDYIIDYYEGKVTFIRILSQTDEFAYSYEYTNIAEQFIPGLIRKNFIGFQSRFKADPAAWGKIKPAPKPIINSALESFPAPLQATKEEEAAGHFQLKNYPVVPFSEIITFRGATLKKDEDFSIKYDEGKIILLLPTLPQKDEPLTVAYSYKKTELVEEILPGSASRGPYVLTNRNLIPDSEEILINDRQVNRDYDYIIDYGEGRIVFNYEIPNTAVIKVRYRYVLLEIPPAPPPPKVPQQLIVGATYLKETSISRFGSAVADYSEPAPFKYADIIKNDNTIYLSRYPLVPTSEGGTLVLSIGSRVLTYGTDYVVPSVKADPLTGYAQVTPPARLAFINDRTDLTDGWATGTIKILTTLEATAEVSALYTYRKSVMGRFTAAGNGSRGPYYIRNYRDILPGTEKVEVWETGSSNTVTYTRNSSFEPDAGGTGYTINYYKENPNITFNKELAPSQNYSISFQYVPPVTPIGGDIAQEIVGFDANYKLGNFLEFDGNIAKSRAEKVTVSLGTIETIVITQPTREVAVSKQPVIENSEKVFVNSYLRNRDLDYAIDYSTGRIVFYYITLGVADRVIVEYDYPDPSGIGQLGEKSDTAYKYGIRSNLGPVSLNYNYKTIGFDFNPLGGTVIGVGSSYRDFSASFAPAFHSLSAQFTYLENNDPVLGNRDLFTHKYDRNYSLSLNPFGLAGMSLGLRNLETRADPLTPSGTPTAKTLQNEYSGSFVPRSLTLGPASYQQIYDGKLIDSEDSLNNTFSRNKYFHTNQAVNLTSRLKLGLDLQFSEPYTLSSYRTTEEARSSWSTNNDIAYEVALDLTMARLKKWTAYAKLINHEAVVRLPTPESRLETKNATYHTELVPFNMLNASYDYTRQETPSIVVQGKNPLSENAATSVNLAPFSNFSTSWGHSEDWTIHETALESRGRSDTYGADWVMLSRENLKLNSHFSKFDRTATAPSGTLESKSDTGTFTQKYNLTLIPLSALSIATGFTIEDYKNITDGQLLEAKSQTTACSIIFKPVPRFSAQLDYGLKNTSSAGVTRPKSTLGLRGSYRVFDWGEVTYGQDQENNQGEVQAGGIFPEIDYFKITNAYGINLTIPQDNPILSAVVLTLSYKTVNFDNRLPGLDSEDFTAQSLIFECTLNL